MRKVQFFSFCVFLPCESLLLLTQNTSPLVTKYVEVFLTPSNFCKSQLGFHSILILSTWRQHQISQVKGSVPQNCSYIGCCWQVQVVTCVSDQLHMNQRFTRLPPQVLLSFQSGLQNTGNPFTHQCMSLLYKLLNNMNQQPDKKIHRVRS